MRRREFIARLGSVVACPLVARAQRPLKRIGVMLSGDEHDPQMQARIDGLRDGLKELGWTEGLNYVLEYRWPRSDTEQARMAARDLVAKRSDAFVAGSMPAAHALRRETEAIPIIFVNLADPVGGGLVPSLAKPGGNVTGFTAFEYNTATKWLQLLKEIAPATSRVAFTFGGAEMGPTGEGFFRSLQSVASQFQVELTPLRIHTAPELARAIDEFAQEPHGGLIAAAELAATNNRRIIIDAAARNVLPAVYPFRYFAVDGGLAVYGVDLIDQYRRAASYVDRVLRGTNPATLPVQAPVKFELVINLRTAKAQSIDIPASLLARADEVIE
jgi:ABC-type uncharacterized transport system substrate-binding protein